MPDPYRIPETPQASAPTRPERARGGLIRPVLWLVLVMSATANAATSSTGLPVPVGVGFGLVTLACAAALVVHHYRRRAR